MLPEHLTAEQRKVALKECKAIPEFFYTRTKLPVITPQLVQQFLQTTPPDANTPITFWSWFAGSAHLSYTMTCPPFTKCVLPPIDLRYGWDIHHEPHQRLLRQLDAYYKPLVTTFEPRCKYWSRSGNRRDPMVTTRMRRQETPMLLFVAHHAVRVQRDGRHGLFENPATSAIWVHSPLMILNSADGYKDNDEVTCMCAFSPEPDGRRSEKRTKLRPSFRLRKCVRGCHCSLPHLQLYT